MCCCSVSCSALTAIGAACLVLGSVIVAAARACAPSTDAHVVPAAVTFLCGAQAAAMPATTANPTAMLVGGSMLIVLGGGLWVVRAALACHACARDTAACCACCCPRRRRRRPLRVALQREAGGDDGSDDGVDTASLLVHGRASLAPGMT